MILWLIFLSLILEAKEAISIDKEEKTINKSLCHEAIIMMDEFNQLNPDLPPHSEKRDLMIEALSKIQGKRLCFDKNVVEQFRKAIQEDLDYLHKSWDINFSGSFFEGKEKYDLSGEEAIYRTIAHSFQYILGRQEDAENSNY